MPTTLDDFEHANLDENGWDGDTFDFDILGPSYEGNEALAFGSKENYQDSEIDKNFSDPIKADVISLYVEPTGDSDQRVVFRDDSYNEIGTLGWSDDTLQWTTENNDAGAITIASNTTSYVHVEIYPDWSAQTVDVAVDGNTEVSNDSMVDSASNWQRVKCVCSGNYPSPTYQGRVDLIQAFEAPSSPSGLFLSGLSNGIRIDWNTVNDATGYKVYRARSSGGTLADYTEVADVNGPPYDDTGLLDGEEYYYRVTAYK